MHTRYLSLVAFVATMLVLVSPVFAQDALTISHPSSETRICKVRTGSIVGSLDDEAVTAIQLRVPSRSSVWLNVASKADKEKFAPAVKEMFPEAFIIEKAVFTTVDQKKRKETQKEYGFDLEKEVDLKKFWASPEFREMYETIYKQRLVTAKLEVEGWTSQTIDATDEESHAVMTGFFMFTTSLEPGNNPYFVRALGADGSVLQSTRINLFYANDYCDDVPEEIGERKAFHGEAFDEQCSGCHDVELPESALAGGESVEEQCSVCHASFEKQLSSHFPVTAWDCISCHDAGATPQFALHAEKDFDTGACFECHSGIEEATTSSPHIHYPATDRCMSCHDAHSSPNPSLLVDEVYTICASCHEDAATTPHPIVNHPLRTVHKPSKEPSTIECSSCHLPHASEQPKLLTTSRKNLCKNCHNF